MKLGFEGCKLYTWLSISSFTVNSIIIQKSQSYLALKQEQFKPPKQVLCFVINQPKTEKSRINKVAASTPHRFRPFKRVWSTILASIIVACKRKHATDNIPITSRCPIRKVYLKLHTSTLTYSLFR